MKTTGTKSQQLALGSMAPAGAVPALVLVLIVL